MVAGPILDEFDEEPTEEERRRVAPEIMAAIQSEDELVDAVALAIAQATRRMARCASHNIWAKIDAMHAEGEGVDLLDTITWRYEARAALAMIIERYRICRAFPAGDGVTWQIVDEWRLDQGEADETESGTTTDEAPGPAAAGRGRRGPAAG